MRLTKDNTIRPILLTGLALAVHAATVFASASPSAPALLPMPQKVTWSHSAIPIKDARVIIDDRVQSRLRIREELFALMQQHRVHALSESNMTIKLTLDKVHVPFGEDEAYHLRVGKKGVFVTANKALGLYRAVQTLRQLTVSREGRTTIATCEILDYPAFRIRGFMHDVGRNFQSIKQLKMQIDVMARYKMNVFHWHLTDHYGWRLESKLYPQLQANSSFTRDVGKFYTQKQFVHFTEYCAARGITVIPEFDSPGHSGALRRALGIKSMRDPKAKQAVVTLIHELCSLVGKEQMPYIHLGTDEVRHASERVDPDYLPALHEAVHANGREVIGWWHGMLLPGDKQQILQTWAGAGPVKDMRHIDSRANYLNHLEALDFVARMVFKQPCQRPHGDALNLGGILCHWPDNRVNDERLTLTNNPVLPAVVAYSEAVWSGIDKDQPEYWAKLPPQGSEDFECYVDFENRLAEQRDRFMQGKPFPFVKCHQIEWRLLGPVADGEVPSLENGTIKDIYREGNGIYRWTSPLRGGAVHVRHFFGFPGHLKHFRKDKNVVWARTFIHSDTKQTVGAWINFNTTSTSDNRAGVAKSGDWNSNPLCNIWINGKRIPPPAWRNPGKMGKEFAFTDEIYTSREPTRIDLKKGWNSVLIKSAPQWKWVFSFSPVETDNGNVREIPDIKFSSAIPPQATRN